jgi:hypothetical protein
VLMARFEVPAQAGVRGMVESRSVHGTMLARAQRSRPTVTDRCRSTTG